MKSIRILKGKRVVECHLDDDNYPTFKVRILEEDDKTLILKEEFKNVGKHWTNDDVKQLKSLFESEDGDLLKISQKLERSENSIRIKLLSMVLSMKMVKRWMSLKRTTNPYHLRSGLNRKSINLECCLMGPMATSKKPLKN